jgi:hypothetical protein
MIDSCFFFCIPFFTALNRYPLTAQQDVQPVQANAPVSGQAEAKTDNRMSAKDAFQGRPRKPSFVSQRVSRLNLKAKQAQKLTICRKFENDLQSLGNYLFLVFFIIFFLIFRDVLNLIPSRHSEPVAAPLRAMHQALLLKQPQRLGGTQDHQPAQVQRRRGDDSAAGGRLQQPHHVRDLLGEIQRHCANGGHWVMPSLLSFCLISFFLTISLPFETS